MGSAYHTMRIWTHFCIQPQSHLHKKQKQLTFSKKYKSPIYPNPLENHLIFDKILSHLDFRDLLQVRQVCSSWNTQILKQFQKLPNPIYLKFQHDLDLRDLIKSTKTSDPSDFNIRNFYFKIPRCNILLVKALHTFQIQEAIVHLKIAIYTTDFSILLVHLKKLRNLKELNIIRIPVLSQYTSQLVQLPTQLNTSPDCTLDKLETLKLRTLCSRRISFFCKHECCTHALISFLKCTPSLKHLEFNSWPGKIIKIIDASRVYKNLEVFIVKGRNLGNDDVKHLSSLEFLNLQRVELKFDKSVMQHVVRNFLDGYAIRK